MNEEETGALGKIAGMILTSPKFFEFIEKANIGDLVKDVLRIPGMREKLLERFKQMGRDLRERYKIEKWDWHADKENGEFTIELDIDTAEMRKDFSEHFHTFLQTLRAKFGGGFDMFLKIYKIKGIGCHEEGERVKIVVSTPRVADLEAVILAIGTADGTTFKGGGGRNEEG